MRQSTMTQHRKTGLATLSVICGFALTNSAQPEPAMAIENDYARITVGADGRTTQFADRQSGTNHCAQPGKLPFARISQGGKSYPATEASYADGRLTLRFGEADVTAVLKVAAQRRYFTVEVESVSDKSISQFTFVDVRLTLRGAPVEPFAGCALALNLLTRVNGIPQATSRLAAHCYPRFGLAGAKVALIACPQADLRSVMQQVVTDSPDLPKSDIGGPWALARVCGILRVFSSVTGGVAA